VVHLFDKNGVELASVRFVIPGAATVQTNSVARRRDGVLALSGNAISADGKAAPFLAILSADGKSQQTVRTDPFYPEAVAIAADGTICTAGWDLRDGRETNFDHGMVRQFDSSGKVIQERIPRSLYPTDISRPSPVVDSLLATAGGRIGWYAPSAKEYFEMVPDGTLRHWSVAEVLEQRESVVGLALTEDGNAFLGIYSTAKREWGLAVVYADGTRRRLPPPAGLTGWARLVGASGNRIVTANQGVLRLYSSTEQSQ